MNGLGTITHAKNGEYVLHYERIVAQPAAKVWAALTDPAVAKNWLGGEVETELRLGGKFVIHFPGGKTVMTGVIQALETERLIEYSWLENYGMPPSVVRWTVTPQSTGCSLTLTHTLPPGCKAEDVISFGGGWHAFLDAIPIAAGGEDATKLAYDEACWPEFEKQYTAIFKRTKEQP